MRTRPRPCAQAARPPPDWRLRQPERAASPLPSPAKRTASRRTPRSDRSGKGARAPARGLVRRRDAADEADHEWLAALAVAAGESGHDRPGPVDNLANITLDRPLRQSEAFRDLRAPEPRAVEGKYVTSPLRQGGGDHANQGVEVRVVFEGDQLLDRAGLVDRNALQATADGGVGRNLAVLSIGVVAEDSMGCGAQPGIRLAGLRDVVGFVQKALTGGLHGILDFVVGACGMPGGELDAEGSPALAADVALEQGGCAVCRGRVVVHHYNRGGRAGFGPLDCWRGAAQWTPPGTIREPLGSDIQRLYPFFGTSTQADRFAVRGPSGPKPRAQSERRGREIRALRSRSTGKAEIAVSRLARCRPLRGKLAR